MKKKIKKGDEWEGFDDCPICQAMKDGKAGTVDELKKVFNEANKINKKDINSENVFSSDFVSKRMVMRVQNKNDLYYDASDAVEVGDYINAKKFLKQALSMDEDYVQTYIGFVNLYGVSGKSKKAQEYIKLAFEKTQKKFKKWPKKMLWGIIDNRAYLRAIQFRADIYLDDDEKEKAIELYRLLLKLNPDDNQGIRYMLAGVYAGISGDKINKMFDEGNRKQDWSKLGKLVDTENKKHKFWIMKK